MRRALLLALLATSPALAQKADRHAMIDQLLNDLQNAPNPQAAAMLEARIDQLWLQSGSAAATLLMTRGLRDLQSGAHDEAYDEFDSALALEPNFAEAWLQRGVARAAGGDTAGAIADIGEALSREPRQFSALKALSHIANRAAIGSAHSPPGRECWKSIRKRRTELSG